MHLGRDRKKTPSPENTWFSVFPRKKPVGKKRKFGVGKKDQRKGSTVFEFTTGRPATISENLGNKTLHKEES